MNDLPLVSIATPCYNSAGTLPRALASLVAQSYPRWECLVVDDGSDDDPAAAVGRAGDRRIRLIRLDRNRGRGVARQVALDAARGEFLGMLDADDWFHPEKLARQVEMFQKRPELTVVGTGMAVVGRSGELAGVRCCEPIEGLVARLERPRLAHAPCLIRMGDARAAGYDSALNYSEDVDFLIRVLRGRRYAVVPAPLYAYSEFDSVNLRKVVAGLQSLRRVFRKYRREAPIASRLEGAKLALKIPAYAIGFAAGAGDRLLSARSSRPDAAAVGDFEAARGQVEAVLRGWSSSAADEREACACLSGRG